MAVIARTQQHSLLRLAGLDRRDVSCWRLKWGCKKIRHGQRSLDEPCPLQASMPPVTRFRPTQSDGMTINENYRRTSHEHHPPTRDVLSLVRRSDSRRS